MPSGLSLPGLREVRRFRLGAGAGCLMASALAAEYSVLTIYPFLEIELLWFDLGTELFG